MEIYVTLGYGQPNGTGYIKIIGPNHMTCRAAAHALTNGRFCTSYESLEALHPMDRTHRCTIEASADETQPCIMSIFDINCDLSAFEGWEPEMIALIGAEND